MVNNFKSDRQRKAVMAKLNQGTTRAETRPSIIGRLRKKFRPTSEELAKQRGARIKKEAEALERERLTTQQLEAEARLEIERESVASRQREARQRLKDIDVARRERRLAPLRAGVARLKEAGVAVAKATAPKPQRRRKARPKKEEPGFFGI